MKHTRTDATITIPPLKDVPQNVRDLFGIDKDGKTKTVNPLYSEIDQLREQNKNLREAAYKLLEIVYLDGEKSLDYPAVKEMWAALAATKKEGAL
jgi:hypothetical protein